MQLRIGTKALDEIDDTEELVLGHPALRAADGREYPLRINAGYRRWNGGSTRVCPRRARARRTCTLRHCKSLVADHIHARVQRAGRIGGRAIHRSLAFDGGSMDWSA